MWCKQALQLKYVTCRVAGLSIVFVAVLLSVRMGMHALAWGPYPIDT
jgi:hypothetical protein